VLDAPAFQDDFYLNLVDWSSHNVLAVGLGNCVYLWNACSMCVGWVAQRGTSLAVGTSNGKVQIWDAAHYKSILQRDPRAQEAFVSKLNGHKSEWSYDNREIASGGNDNRRQSQMSASNNMQLPTHSVLSVVMDAVSEGPSQSYVSYHMHFQQHNLNSMRNDQSGRYPTPARHISIIPTASTGTVIGDRQQQFYNYHIDQYQTVSMMSGPPSPNMGTQ
ncbi:FIZZY-related 2-like protein, partial [Tanacetum coccineum]